MAPRPRGRPRKRDTRMDAAMDAMAPFGFAQKLVYKTVKELLNVYSEEGWVFIEEGAYKLLIDTLLEKGEPEEDEDDDHKGDSSQGNASSQVNDTPTAEPESEAVPDCSNAQVSDTASQTNGHVDSASGTNEARKPASAGNNVHENTRPPNESKKRQVSDQNIDDKLTETSTKNLNTASEDHPCNIISRPTDDDENRHCHGWIDDNEEMKLIELTPAPLPESLRRMLNKTDGFEELTKKKHRSGWDVKPNDM